MRAIANLRSNTAFEIKNPEEEWKKYPTPKEIDTKVKHSKWTTDPTTDHAFVSCVVGADPRVRVSSKQGNEEISNPATWLHGIIADYDQVMADITVTDRLAAAPCPYHPRFVLNTFTEGKRRLVWEFSCPVRMAGDRHTQQFYLLLRERLKLDAWLPGFDKNGHKPGQYFDIGTHWTVVSPDAIPRNVVLGWAVESALKLKIFDGRERPAVPIERIADLVVDQFPGRWEGDFVLGAQGLRFWDSEADNDRAAVVAEHGMVCFTGQKSFVSWEEIFGERIIDELRGDHWGGLFERYYWDKKSFWRYDEEAGYWIDDNVDNTHRLWKRNGVSAVRKKGEPESDLDKLHGLVIDKHRVFAALPFVYRPTGMMMWEGRKYLNTSDVKVANPAIKDHSIALYDFDDYGKKHFPFLHLFLRNLHETPLARLSGIPDTTPLGDIPLFIQLAWLKRTYEGGYFQNPLPGQAVVHAGLAGIGKTFLTQGVYGTLLGPVYDGKDYVVEGSAFSSLAFERAIIHVDDSLASTSTEKHKAFTAMVKKIVANSTVHYNKKYGSEGQTMWQGRLVISCNIDEESLRILPDLDQSTADKIMMFLLKHSMVLPNQHKLQEHLDAEIPFLARFLLEWEPPEWVYGPTESRGRFGVRCYHHTMLRDVASAAGTPNTILELLRETYEDWCSAEADAEELFQGAKRNGSDKSWVWEGRSSRLYRELSTSYPSLMNKGMTPYQLSIALGVLNSRGFGVHKIGGGRWKIEFNERLYSTVTELETEE